LIFDFYPSGKILLGSPFTKGDDIVSSPKIILTRQLIVLLIKEPVQYSIREGDKAD
jgi:hypothetical protein